MIVSYRKLRFLNSICTYILKILDNIFYLGLLIENLIMKLCVENFDYYFYTCEIYDLVIWLINWFCMSIFFKTCFYDWKNFELYI